MLSLWGYSIFVSKYLGVIQRTRCASYSSQVTEVFFEYMFLCF